MAPRPRKKSADQWLPTRVYKGRSAHEWHPRGGGNIKLHPLEKDENNEIIETPEIRLAVLSAYDEIKSKLYERDSISTLLTAYFGSAQFRQLSKRTQSDYRRYRKIVEPVFGKMEPRVVRQHHVRAFMDKKAEKHSVTANRCHSFLSTLFASGLERQYCSINPCQGVRKFREKPRDRYVEDHEYNIVYAVAAHHPIYAYIAPLMELIYLCRLRPNEAYSLTEDEHILPEGIYAQRGKGSSSETTEWSERLRAAVGFARSLRGNQPRTLNNQPVVTNSKGGRLIKSSFDTAWRRVMGIAVSEGIMIDGRTVILENRFRAHDLKAKGVTDHPQKYAGHRSEKMRAVYNRRPDLIKATK